MGNRGTVRKPGRYRPTGDRQEDRVRADRQEDRVTADRQEDGPWQAGSSSLAALAPGVAGSRTPVMQKPQHLPAEWSLPGIPACERQRWQDQKPKVCHPLLHIEYKASLGYMRLFEVPYKLNIEDLPTVGPHIGGRIGAPSQLGLPAHSIIHENPSEGAV